MDVHCWMHLFFMMLDLGRHNQMLGIKAGSNHGGEAGETLLRFFQKACFVAALQGLEVRPLRRQ